MSAVKIAIKSEGKARKTFVVRPAQTKPDFAALIDLAIKRFPKVHAVLAK